jgi:hypothetical protein
MAFSAAEKAKIRKWLGYSPIFQGQYPALDAAIIAVQSIADGGTLADSETEDLIQGYLTELDQIDTRLEELRDQMEASVVDEVKADSARAMLAVYKEGRRFVGHIADALGALPARDVFSPKRMNFYPRFP